MKKKVLRSSEKVAVTFEMPATIACDSLSLVGDFNDWDQDATPMKRRVDGSWSKTVNLMPGKYRYRYLADGETWHNDWRADAYEPNEYGQEDSVVSINGM